jgi:hypothetical protein
MLGANTSRPVRLEWLVRETILGGRGAGIVAALREREWVERQRMSDAYAADDGPVYYDARKNVVCISVFLQGARVEPPPGVVSIALSRELIALVRPGLLRELASTAKEIGQAAVRRDYEKDAARYCGPLERQDAIRELLGLVGWESSKEEKEPATVYLDRYRGALLAAAQNEHAHQTRRAERARSSGRARAAAEANRALLASLIEAIGGEA